VNFFNFVLKPPKTKHIQCEIWVLKQNQLRTTDLDP